MIPRPWLCLRIQGVFAYLSFVATSTCYQGSEKRGKIRLGNLFKWFFGSRRRQGSDSSLWDKSSLLWMTLGCIRRNCFPARFPILHLHFRKRIERKRVFRVLFRVTKFTNSVLRNAKSVPSRKLGFDGRTWVKYSKKVSLTPPPFPPTFFCPWILPPNFAGGGFFSHVIL